MSPEVQTALIQLGIRAADALIFRFLIPWVESLVAARAEPSEVLMMAQEITAGIQRAHPEWDGPLKKSYAWDALVLWADGKGLTIAPRDINLAIELAVQGQGHVATPAVDVDRA